MGDYINRLILWCKVRFAGCHLAIHKHPKPLPLSSNHKHDQGAWIDYKGKLSSLTINAENYLSKWNHKTLWYGSSGTLKNLNAKCVYWMITAWKWIGLFTSAMMYCKNHSKWFIIVWHNLHRTSVFLITVVTHIKEGPLRCCTYGRQALTQDRSCSGIWPLTLRQRFIVFTGWDLFNRASSH